MKLLLLTILLTLSGVSFAHGSSHPNKCTYERVRYDLVGHCQNYSGSRTWTTTDKDYYTTENMAKRIEEQEKEEWRTKYIFFPALIVVLLGFFGLILYGLKDLE